jgi:hypothetical protein
MGKKKKMSSAAGGRMENAPAQRNPSASAGITDGQASLERAMIYIELHP